MLGPRLSGETGLNDGPVPSRRIDPPVHHPALLTKTARRHAETCRRALRQRGHHRSRIRRAQHAREVRDVDLHGPSRCREPIVCGHRGRAEIGAVHNPEAVRPEASLPLRFRQRFGTRRGGSQGRRKEHARDQDEQSHAFHHLAQRSRRQRPDIRGPRPFERVRTWRSRVRRRCSRTSRRRGRSTRGARRASGSRRQRPRWRRRPGMQRRRRGGGR